MSHKSSSASYTGSSGGETRVSSMSSVSSSRRRRAAVAGGGPRIPPALMSSQERLQLLRNALTRIGMICERQRQSSSVSTTLSPADAQRVTEVFAYLREKLPKMEYNKKKMGDGMEGPKFLSYVSNEAEKLLARVGDALSSISQEEDPKDVEGVKVYVGLHRKMLVELQKELSDVRELLSKPPHQQLSRIRRELLDDLVAIHISEFDAFMETRVKCFIEESINECAFWSSGASGESIAIRGEKPCFGIVSPVMLDFVVGVRPSRSARIVATHALSIIQELHERVEREENTLNLTRENATPGEEVLRLHQMTDFAKMKTRTSQALSDIRDAKANWEAEEDTIFAKALSGTHLEELLRMKRIQEEEVIAAILGVYDATVQVCLPFATPQYYRRQGMHYTQPTHLRLGVRCLGNPAELGDEADHCVTSSFLLPVLNAEFYALFRVDPTQYLKYAELAPSKDQLWVPFGDFPEMVRGTRCALRRADPRVDFPRALEEQKEVGGYFIINGGERILRSLLMQRTNVPINIQREKFAVQGRHFSSKAVVIRCKRPSGLTVQNYLYYTTDGELILSFSRKIVWNVPFLLLLHAVNIDNLSAVSIFNSLSVGCGQKENTEVHSARVEALLQHHRTQSYGELVSHLDYLMLLGHMYRAYHAQHYTFTFLPEHSRDTALQNDAWYGMFMLRRHILPHLNEDVPTPDLAPDATEEEIMQWLTPPLQRELRKKFDLLLAMARQLYSFVDEQTGHQGNDVPAYQEIITVSQILIGSFEVCTQRVLRGTSRRLSSSISKSAFLRVLSLPNSTVKDAQETIRQLRDYLQSSLKRSGSPLTPLIQLLSTGNFLVDREEDFYCPQNAGFVVMAEHLNFYRFFEQLRCVHRGQTIAQMRSSEVRKYPCESYGFICMVHSPDGEDCGVSNYLSNSTIFSSSIERHEGSAQQRTLREWLIKEMPELQKKEYLGTPVHALSQYVPVWLEGEVLGYIPPERAAKAAVGLRRKKQIVSSRLVDASGTILRRRVTPLHTMEIVYIPPESRKDPPGLYIFVDCGRLSRPVQVLHGVSEEAAPDPLPFPLVYIGTWEQSWLNIASVAADLADSWRHLGKTYDFIEQSGSNLISFTSNTIPFFEYNCSPRNLFQCGLNKQSSGTQLQALAWRKEAKLFRTYVPQRYISRTLAMDAYNVDDVNLGINAVVAILAYTGYDMDDAMIMNSCASQRGMLNAGITVAKVIRASGPMGKNEEYVFHNIQSTGERYSTELDPRGLPYLRVPQTTPSFSFQTDHSHPSLHEKNDVYCCALRQKRIDPLTNQPIYEYSRHRTTKWKHFDKGENGWVHKVVPLEYSGPDPVSVLMVFRIPRPPTIGDKFSSRHGQKGTLPLHIRSYDLPFSTVSGITPDIIINPHAFPSRMTVGMVLEIMMAKVGALEGRFMDNSPWSVVDDRPVVAEAIGETLAKLGYHRYGRESLIDGISGEVMEADVFMGVSGYQRLRHQVSDKWQARARTDSDRFRAVTKTGQPVKGRKHHGGVRIGEMERDALLSHGMSEVVLDRLLHVSDKTKAYVCPVCGDLLSVYERHATEYGTWKTCRFCGVGDEEGTDKIALVDIPQVLRLWAAELTSIGIRVALRTADE